MSQGEKKKSGRVSVDENPISRHSSKHTRISKMSYGGSISDIEADESDKYRKMAKKLSRDKCDLKDKLRRLLDDVEQKSREHRIELEKTQDYFQDQINELVEERDKEREKTENMRESILEEKEKLREQYEQKLSKQKESLEKRYRGKDSEVIKRLENTIATLQDRLNKQIEQRENVKDTAEQFYNQKEEQFRKTIRELEEQLQKVKESHAKDLHNLQILTKTCADEKEQIIRKMTQEKDIEMEQIIMEKNSTVMALQNIKDQLEKRTQELDHKRDFLIAQSKQETENFKIDSERKQNEFVQSCKKSIEDFKQEYERKLAACESNHKIEVEKIVKEHQKIVENISSENLKKIDIFTNKYEEKNREINDLRLKNDKIKGESEDTINRLREQFAQLRENMKKVQDNAQAMNTQFVSNLNKQKELADKEIFTRDQTIVYLESQLKKLGEESVDRFNVLDRRAKFFGEENKDISDKYNVMKASVEKYEQTINNLKNELQKTKELLMNSQEQYRQYQFNIGIAEQKLKIELEQKTNEFALLSKTYQEFKSKFISVVTNYTNVQSQVKTVSENSEKYLQTITQKDKEIALLTKAVNTAKTELVSAKKTFSDELNKKLQEVNSENSEKYLQTITQKDKEIAFLKKVVNTVKTELARARKTFSDELNKKLQEVNSEKERKISEYTDILRVKQEQLQEREREIRKIREAPLDQGIVKEKDEALAELKQVKLELTKTKDQALHLSQNLLTVERLFKDLQNEKQLIIKTQSELKETFINNLNQQEEKHHNELNLKNERINELEKMLTDKITKKED